MAPVRNISLPIEQYQRGKPELGKLTFCHTGDHPLTAGDVTTHFGGVSNLTDVEIYAESLALTDSFIAAGVNLGIHVTELTLANEKSSEHAWIDTSGSPGANYILGAGAPATLDGHAGGRLHVYIQELSQDSERLTILSKGGKGGDSQFANTFGGTGGAGGNVAIVACTRFTELHDVIQGVLKHQWFDPKVALKTKTWPPASATSTPESSSPAIPKDNLQLAADIVSNITAARDQYSEVDKGVIDSFFASFDGVIKSQGPQTFAAVRDALVMVVASIRQHKKKATEKITSGAATSGGGDPGGPDSNKKEPSVHFGDSGPAGKTYSSYLPEFNTETRAESLRKSPVPFAHPEQCEMLLEKAVNLLFFNSPTFTKRAVMLLQRLVTRLSFLPLQATDPLYKAYAAHEVFKKMEWATRLEQVLTSARKHLAYHYTGQSAFTGYEANHYPLLSYHQYQTDLDAASRDLDAFETAYVGYMAKLDNQEQLNLSSMVGRSIVEEHAKSISNDINDLSKMCCNKLDKIDHLKQPVTNARAAVLAQYELVKHTISEDFELSFPQLISAATSIAFSPEMPMQAVQAANVLYEGSTSIPDGAGVPQRKTLLLDKLTTGLANVSTFSTAAKFESDGSLIRPDGEIGAKLLVDQKTLEDFVKDFATSNFGKAGQDLLQKLDDFIKLVTARNTAIVEFNVYVSMIKDRSSALEKNAEEGSKIDANKLTYTDTEIESMTSWMRESYQQARLAYMKILARMQLAIQYRWLIYNDLLLVPSDALHPTTKSPLDTYDAPQAMNAFTLKTLRKNVEANFEPALEIWVGPPESMLGLEWKLPDAKRDELMTRVKQAQLRAADASDDGVPAVPTSSTSETPSTTTPVPAPPPPPEPVIAVTFQIPVPNTHEKSPFIDLCNIRIHRTKLIFADLGLADDIDSALFTVRLTQSTPDKHPEIVQDRHGTNHTFYHSPIERVYKFRVDRIVDPRGEQGDTFKITDVVGGDVQVEFTKDEGETLDWVNPGPFTTWTLDISGTNVGEFDFVDSSDVSLKFTGTSYSTVKW